MSWRDEANCRNVDPDMFFPDAGRRTENERFILTARAKAVCGDCPVRAECQTYAAETRQGFGVWGGVTAADRAGARGYTKAPSDGLCTLDGCNNLYLAKGFCQWHYNRWKRWGDPRHNESDRFGRAGFTLSELVKLDGYSDNAAANALGADRKTVVAARRKLADNPDARGSVSGVRQ